MQNDTLIIQSISAGALFDVQVDLRHEHYRIRVYKDFLEGMRLLLQALSFSCFWMKSFEHNTATPFGVYKHTHFFSSWDVFHFLLEGNKHIHTLRAECLFEPPELMESRDCSKKMPEFSGRAQTKLSFNDN